MKSITKLEKKSGKRLRRSLSIFISYSHHNRVWKKRLDPLLVGLQYDDRFRGLVGVNQVSSWHDKLLKAGDEWDDQIRKALGEMDVFVPLVSAQFFASWYVMNIELPKARERHEMGEIQIVPILLENVNLQQKCQFLAAFNPLPSFGRWWSNYRSFTDANRLIDDGLWSVIQAALGTTRKGESALIV